VTIATGTIAIFTRSQQPSHARITVPSGPTTGIDGDAVQIALAFAAQADVQLLTSRAVSSNRRATAVPAGRTDEQHALAPRARVAPPPRGAKVSAAPAGPCVLAARRLRDARQARLRALLRDARAAATWAVAFRGPSGIKRRPTTNRIRTAATIALVVGLASCKGAQPSRPRSILLFVFDTTRVDAVSAYGGVAGTTPTADSLAAEGLRYTHAYSQAPWTLPSHATLFSGLLPSQHGVGWRRTRAPDTWVTLAGRLHDAGYETVGVAENAWLNEAFNMTKGFERFVGAEVDRFAPPDVRTTVAEWVHERDGKRPFFLFVNVVDAHNPYHVRPTNPFLPPGVDAEMATAVPQDPAYYFCSWAPHTHELEILRGLYLGGVAEADAKLRDVLTTLRDADLGHDLVTIVTADHGELFGEHRLVHHQFTVLEGLLHVPLIVHGLPAVSPAVIDSPVRLADVMPTVLRWARARVPDGLAGQPLPTVANPTTTALPVIAEQFDLDGEVTPDPIPMAAAMRKVTDNIRRYCTPEDRVFGDMRALIHYPFKLIWYAQYPAELYDLTLDPEEQHDLAPTQAALVADLVKDLERRVNWSPPRVGDQSPEGTDLLPSPQLMNRLKALGYVGTDP